MTQNDSYCTKQGNLRLQQSSLSMLLYVLHPLSITMHSNILSIPIGIRNLADFSWASWLYIKPYVLQSSFAALKVSFQLNKLHLVKTAYNYHHGCPQNNPRDNFLCVLGVILIRTRCLTFKIHLMYTCILLHWKSRAFFKFPPIYNHIYLSYKHNRYLFCNLYQIISE